MTETQRNASLQRDPSSPLTATAGYSWRCAGVARGGAPRSGAPPVPGAPARPTAPLPCGWLRCRTPTDLPRAYFVGLLAYKKIIIKKKKNRNARGHYSSAARKQIALRPTPLADSHTYYPKSHSFPLVLPLTEVQRRAACHPRGKAGHVPPDRRLRALRAQNEPRNFPDARGSLPPPRSAPVRAADSQPQPPGTGGTSCAQLRARGAGPR